MIDEQDPEFEKNHARRKIAVISLWRFEEELARGEVPEWMKEDRPALLKELRDQIEFIDMVTRWQFAADPFPTESIEELEEVFREDVEEALREFRKWRIEPKAGGQRKRKRKPGRAGQIRRKEPKAAQSGAAESTDEPAPELSASATVIHERGGEETAIVPDVSTAVAGNKAL